MARDERRSGFAGSLRPHCSYEEQSLNTSFDIRRASHADAAVVAELCGELGYPVSAQEMAARLADLLPRTSQFIAVATDGAGAVIAWIAAERRYLIEYGEKIEIVGLVVGAAARRSGAGKALVQAVEQWAREQRLAAVVVRSNAARSESHPFYERLGFVRKKTQHSYEKIVVV
jgi:GNAT superfamily N-acetyltransferase